MKLPSKTLERKLFKSGYCQVIGVDEVGMGCLAGPVVVCAVLFTPTFFKKAHKKLNRLRDSKQLLPHQREKFYKELLKEKSIRYQLASCSPATIDKMNIYQAARLAMKKAVEKVSSVKYPVSSIKTEIKKTQNTKYKIRDTMVLVDGKTKIPDLKIAQQAIVKGDRKVFAIACASIIAKVTRDKMMVNYAKKYPQYGFAKHKGYGTKLHNANLIKYGLCEIHRRSFAPIAKLL